MAKGEELVISNRDLTADEIAGVDGVVRKNISTGGRMAKNELPLNRLIESERLLNPRLAELSGQQRSAISQLRNEITP